MGIKWPDGYSASVDVFLELDGQRYCVERLSDGNFDLRDDCECAPGTLANLVIVIDGDERKFPILLSRGIAEARELVPFF